MVDLKRLLVCQAKQNSAIFSPWHDAVGTGTKPPWLFCVPPLSSVLHPPLHQIVGTEVSPILTVEVV